MSVNQVDSKPTTSSLAFVNRGASNAGVGASDPFSIVLDITSRSSGQENFRSDPNDSHPARSTQALDDSERRISDRERDTDRPSSSNDDERQTHQVDSTDSTDSRSSEQANDDRNVRQTDEGDSTVDSVRNPVPQQSDESFIDHGGIHAVDDGLYEQYRGDPQIEADLRRQRGDAKSEAESLAADDQLVNDQTPAVSNVTNPEGRTLAESGVELADEHAGERLFGRRKRLLASRDGSVNLGGATRATADQSQTQPNIETTTTDAGNPNVVEQLAGESTAAKERDSRDVKGRKRVGRQARTINRREVRGGNTATEASLGGKSASIQSNESVANANSNTELTSLVLPSSPDAVIEGNPLIISRVGSPTSPAQGGATTATESNQINPVSSGISASNDSGSEASRRAVEQMGRGESAQQLDRSQQRRLIQRVTRAFQMARARDGQIRLRLSPPELGSLRLELRLQDGRLNAQLQTETAAARQVIADNLSVLRDRLSEQGITIESFEISSSDERESGDSSRPNDSHRQQMRDPNQRSNESTEPEQERSAEQSLNTRSNEGFPDKDEGNQRLNITV